MEPYRPVHSGLDIDEFWRQMECHLAPALAGSVGTARAAAHYHLAIR